MAGKVQSAGFRLSEYGFSQRKRPTARVSLSRVAIRGAGTRSRTRDLLITSQLLYQLSYTGKKGRHYSHGARGVNH